MEMYLKKKKKDRSSLFKEHVFIEQNIPFQSHLLIFITLGKVTKQPQNLISDITHSGATRLGANNNEANEIVSRLLYYTGHSGEGALLPFCVVFFKFVLSYQNNLITSEYVRI